jgi:hypothetical protein
MFWKKDKDQKKLSRPRELPEFVKKYIEANQFVDVASLPFLKVVVKASENGNKNSEIIVYDPSDAEAREIKVENYESIKANPALIMLEGSVNESEKKVNLAAKKNIPKIKFYTEDEIVQQIEGLKTPNSSIYFFVNAGTGSGGPLGRGCAIVKLNSENGKKVKKYGIYGASVIDMQPSKNESKIFDSDKSKEVAKWIATSHKPRFC